MVPTPSPKLKRETLKAKKILEKKLKSLNIQKKANDVLKNYDKEITSMDKLTINLVNTYRKLIIRCIIEKNMESIKQKFNLSGNDSKTIYSNIEKKNKEQGQKQKQKAEQKEKLIKEIKELEQKLKEKEKNSRDELEFVNILKMIMQPKDKIKALNEFSKRKGLADYLKNIITKAKDKLEGKKISNQKEIKPEVIKKPLPPVLTKEEEIVKKIPVLKEEVSKDKKEIEKLQKELGKMRLKKVLGPPPGLKNTELYDASGKLKPPPGLTQTLIEKVDRIDAGVKDLERKISYGKDDKDINTKGMKKIIKPPMEPPVTEGVLDARYVKNVRILYDGSVKNLKEYPKIYEKLINPQLINFKGADKIIEDTVNEKDQKLKPSSQVWIKCSKKCFDNLSKLLDKESELTAFMLKVLSECVIDTTNGKMPLIFTCKNQDGDKLTGIWKNDSQYFYLEPLDNTTKQRRLIMGFGPSASGKTYWAENIIKMLNSTDKSFPKAFLSVDGGKVREISYMYQHIIQEIKKHDKILGFDNLVKAGMSIGRSLFESNSVKKAIKKYLDVQRKRPPGPPVSLYIPETLGSCANPFKSCSGKYSDWIRITGDKKSWIGLYIWQHKTPGSCDKPDGFKCVSCQISGTSRELDEGKKYSNSAYSTSVSYGIIQMKNAPGGRFNIHNCGNRDFCKTNKSTIKELPVKGKYILDKNKVMVENKYNSAYFTTKSTDEEIWIALNNAHNEAENNEEKKEMDQLRTKFKPKPKEKPKEKPKPKPKAKQNANNKTVNTTIFDGGNICKGVKVTAKTCGEHVYKHTDKKIYVCRNPSKTPTKSKPGRCRPAAGIFGNSRSRAKKNHPILVERKKREDRMKKQPAPQGVGKRVISSENKSKSDSLRKNVLKRNATRKKGKNKGNNKTKKKK